MRRHIFVDSCSNNGVISMSKSKFSCRIIQSRCFIMIKPHFCILIFFSNTNLRIYFPLWIHLNASLHTISYIGALGIDFRIFQMLQYLSILIATYVVDHITCFNPSMACVACIINNSFREQIEDKLLNDVLTCLAISPQFFKYSSYCTSFFFVIQFSLMIHVFYTYCKVVLYRTFYCILLVIDLDLVHTPLKKRQPADIWYSPASLSAFSGRFIAII